MPQLQQASVGNRLLAALSPEDFALLQPDLERVQLPLRHVLNVPDQPIENVVFPEKGLVSATLNTSEGKIEVGIIGCEGMTGVCIVLATDRSPYEIFVQGEGLRISAEALKHALDRSPSLSRSMLRYAQALMIQTSATAFANATFTLESRLARWLLMAHDRVEGDEIHLTHEFLSMMLGVRRAGVTVTTHVLEGNHLIRAKRGRITIVDRSKLEELADDSYGMPEREYARLMGC